MSLLSKILKMSGLEKFKLFAFAGVTVALVITFALMYGKIQKLESDNFQLDFRNKAYYNQIMDMQKSAAAARAVSSAEGARAAARNKTRKEILNDLQSTPQSGARIDDSWNALFDRLYGDEGDPAGRP